jgi:hydroxypyruvate isomerase
MLRLAANLSTLFTERPLEERFEAAATAGFRAVELQFPYELGAARLRRLVDDAGVQLVLFNAPPGALARGERGLAGLPGREAEFRASIDVALEFAAQSGCGLLHVMAGMRDEAIARERQLDTLAENLAAAADRAAALDVAVLLEPINTQVDVPGYLLGDTASALAIIARLARPNVGLQFDFYHQQIMAGDLARRFDGLLPLIRHVQLADNPGRHEPGTGEINFTWLLAHVAASSYAGWVGCEYHPSTTSAAALLWARPLLHQ